MAKMAKMAKKIVTIKSAKLYAPRSKPDTAGVKVELEHTPQKKLAKLIAAHHKDELGKGYYPALKKMEKRLKAKDKSKK